MREDMVKREDIEAGTTYALKPSRRYEHPLRAVVAIRAEGASLIYEGRDGQERSANLSRVVGPWRAHDDAGRVARAAAEDLHQADDARPEGPRAFGYAYPVEYDYADFRIHLTCTVEQARLLATLIRRLP